jgi:hypothetical protein
MADERSEDENPTDDPHRLYFECMSMFSQLEKLVTERGGEGKGLGEKVHSERDRLPEPLFVQLLQIVNIRNRMSHETGPQMLDVAKLSETAALCRSVRDALTALPRSYVRPRSSRYQRGPWGGARPLTFGASSPRSSVAGTAPAPRHRVARVLGFLGFCAFFIVLGRERSCQVSLSELTKSAAVKVRREIGAPASREESARPPRNGQWTPPAAPVDDKPRAAVPKRPVRHAKRTARNDGDPWDQLVESVEASAAQRPPKGAPAKAGPTAEEIDSVLGQ